MEKSKPNYTLLHLHSMLSNGVTNIDSVTKFEEYVEQAKKCGMKALAFTEHGSVFNWWHKKCAIEAAGMKYIHACEMYVTESLDEKVRDNYHCVLIAKNTEGLKELNRLISRSFNRNDNHFYYTPRISYEELIGTSDNIIITTACLGGILYSGTDDLKDKFLHFLLANKNRCFLEIQHHHVFDQMNYNQYLYKLNQQYHLRLVAGTDTHTLNETHLRGRLMLQKSKDIHFDNEEGWDLSFKSYDELVSAYGGQSAVPQDAYLEAIENTNMIADMIETYDIDRSIKYPKIYDNPLETFKEKIKQGIAKHPYLKQRYTDDEINERVEEELEVYQKTQSIDFMLLQTYLREWERGRGIACGYSRGSVSGSMIAYILGITEMDSIKFDLNFFRFQNPSRITLCDIDSDYASQDRDVVKEFLLRDHMNLPSLKSCEIITFNTIALKGAIRDIGRALEMPLSEVGKICDCVYRDDNNKDVIDDNVRTHYSKLFEYVDIVQGTVVSIGTHPSGVLLSDHDIETDIGLCSTSQSEYPVSMLNMKELDDLMNVKLDILGLDNVGLINETCKLLGIERLTPDNVNLDDMDVWRSIRDDTTLVFQWESDSAQAYLRKFISDETLKKVKSLVPDFSMLKWFSFGNGLIRPACASYRDEVAEGKFYTNGLKELDEFLAPTLGHVTMQEDIMQFLVRFCGYSQAESDTVRRGIAKKKGTEKLLPEIEQRFIQYASEHFNVSKEHCAKVIKPFLQVIMDASAYAFSWNHSDSYSCIGYICGYLRYYYPLEFLTAALNIFKSNTEKTAKIIEYASSKGILVQPPRFGKARSVYSYDHGTNSISKGMASIKYLNAASADELYVKCQNSYQYFMDVLQAIKANTTLNTRQIDVLIKLDFFQQYGNARELSEINQMYEFFKCGESKQITKTKVENEALLKIIEQYSNGLNKNGSESKSYTITDMPKLLITCEEWIKSKHLPDFHYKGKMLDQQEFLGYIDLTTNNPDDRRKLFVTEIRPLKSKDDTGAIWGYAVFTKSLGSGKNSRLTLRKDLYDKRPVDKSDIINAQSIVKNDKGYWYLMQYTVL